jgi:hypothetical protein
MSNVGELDELSLTLPFCYYSICNWGVLLIGLREN